MAIADINELRDALAELTALHGWSPLQTPRNMTLALMSHVGAVAGHLQFARDDAAASSELTDDLRGDLADCLVYLLALGDSLGVDVLDEAVQRLRAALAGDTGGGPRLDGGGAP